MRGGVALVLKYWVCGLAVAATMISGAFAADLPVTIKVKKTFAEPAYVTNESLSNIRKMANRSDIEVNGLTTTHFKVGSQVQLQANISGKTWCVSRITAEVSAAYDDVKVFIPREFERGSCRFKAILEHEEKHVATSRRLLDEIAPKIPALFTEAIRQRGSRFCGDSQAKAEELVMAAVKAGQERVMERQRQQQSEAHAAIDSPEEYDRISALCASTIVPSIAVSVKKEFAEPVLVTNQSLAAIRKMANKPEVNGLTNSRFAVKYQTRYRIEGGGSSWCVSSIEADFKAAYDDVKVFVPSEYDPGNCNYAAVSEHGKITIEANRSVLNEVAKRIPAVVTETIQQRGPRFCGTSTSNAEGVAAAALKAGSDRIVALQRQLQAEAQAALESRGAYKKIADSCRGQAKAR